MLKVNNGPHVCVYAGRTYTVESEEVGNLLNLAESKRRSDGKVEGDKIFRDALQLQKSLDYKEQASA